VQTPTLSLLVRRKKEIEAFTPRGTTSSCAQTFAFQGLYEKDGVSRLKSREEADSNARAVRGKTGVIQSVTREVKRQSPPCFTILPPCSARPTRALA
jgi:DNA topoisomerase-3